MTKKVQCKFIILIFNVKNETIQKETVSISLWGYHFRIHNFTKAQIIELRLAAGIIKCAILPKVLIKFKSRPLLMKVS